MEEGLLPDLFPGLGEVLVELTGCSVATVNEITQGEIVNRAMNAVPSTSELFQKHPFFKLYMYIKCNQHSDQQLICAYW